MNYSDLISDLKAIVCVPNDKQADLEQRRAQLFQTKGLSLADAKNMAHQLVERDQSLDDRRLCVECSRLIQGRCKNSVIGTDSRVVLHRCHKFSDSPGMK